MGGSAEHFGRTRPGTLHPRETQALPGPWSLVGRSRDPMRLHKESVDVLPDGQGDAENPQCAGPGDHRDRAGAWRDQVMDSKAHERCGSMTGWACCRRHGWMRTGVWIDPRCTDASEKKP
jgi:hypothetical protein